MTLTLRTVMEAAYEGDRELLQHAKEALADRYGNKVAGIILDTLNAPDKEVFNRFLNLIANMPPEELPANASKEIIAEISFNCAKPDHKMGMESIMELYHADDPFCQQKAKDLTVKYNSRLIHYLIKQYYPTYVGRGTEELFQAGVIGLLLALKAYNPSKTKFNTFARTYIIHELSGQINFNNESTVYYSTVHKKIRAAIDQLNNEKRDVTVKKISILTDISPEVVEKEMQLMEATTISMDSFADKDDFFGDNFYNEGPEKVVEKKTRNECLVNAVKTLPEHIKNIIILRYAYNETLESISRILGIPVGRVKANFQSGLHMLKTNPYLRAVQDEYMSAAQKKMLHYQIHPTQVVTEQRIDDLLDVIASISSVAEGF